MPPAFKFTRQQIIDAALELVRHQGSDALTARSLGDALGCSTKPIFGLFTSMEEVRREVRAAANSLYEACISQDMARGDQPPYKASGMAYIRFARQEQQLFKMLFMCDRTGEPLQEDRESIAPLLTLLQNNLNITGDQAYALHLEMWIYVHGIATMIATNFLPWDEEFISRSLTDIYRGARLRLQEECHGCH